jgi:hypothetical protein
LPRTSWIPFPRIDVEARPRAPATSFDNNSSRERPAKIRLTSDSLIEGDMEGIRAIARIAPGDNTRGTGFLVADRLILTAFHVVADRAKSQARRAPVWRPEPLVVRFGSTEHPDTQWQPASAKIHDRFFSIERDWAVIEIEPPAGLAPVTPFTLAAYGGGPAAFETFGFPTIKQDIGGVYHGKVLAWTADTGEIDADNLGDENAGGISGAPVVVGNVVVGIILRSLASARTGQAITRSLYAIPIEHAMGHLRGLVEWDAGKPIEFQDAVEATLPDDAARLRKAATALRFAGTERPRIARRLLASGLEPAFGALHACSVKGEPAGVVLDRVAAMSMHAEAAGMLRGAAFDQPAAPPPVARIASEEAQIHRWYLLRAFHDEPRFTANRVVVLRRPASEAELAEGTAVDRLLGKIRAQLDKARVLPKQRDELLAPTRIANRGWWLIVVGENRPDVIAELRDRLPNAQILVGLTTAEAFPPPFEALAVPVTPEMSRDEQQELLSVFADVGTTLGVPFDVGGD